MFDSYQDVLGAFDDFLLSLDLPDAIKIQYAEEAVGVLIGVKIAAVSGFDLKKVEAPAIEDHLHFLDLLDFERESEVESFEDDDFLRVYFAKKKKYAGYAKYLLDRVKSGDESSHYDLGMVLGYPKTAVENFKNRPAENESEKAVRARNRFYIHTVENEDAEFSYYERPIFANIKVYMPKMWQKITSDTDKRAA